jgi:HAD superfamily hydrolase (TIGR01509 family)
MSVQAVIFDFDGVVADSEVRANQCLAESLTAIGLPTTYEDSLRYYCGYNWQESEKRIVEKLGGPLPADFRERHRELAKIKFAEGFDPVAGVCDFLASLGDVPRAIASSSNVDYIRNALKKFGFTDTFGEHVYWAAAEGLGVDPAQSLAIEDSPAGATAAVAAGMTVIGFCGGGHILDRDAHAEKLRAVGVHHIAYDYDQVRDIFR